MYQQWLQDKRKVEDIYGDTDLKDPHSRREQRKMVHWYNPEMKRGKKESDWDVKKSYNM